MSGHKLSRRGFLGLAAPRAGPKSPSFSLDAFYGARERAVSASAALPRFNLRAGLPEPSEHATRVGVPELAGGPRRTPGDEP